MNRKHLNLIGSSFALILFLPAALFPQAEDNEFLQQQVLRFEEKLSLSVQELHELNQEIAVDKEPLLKELNRLRTLVTKRRHDIDGHFLAQKETEQALQLVKADLKEFESHLDYAASLISDYGENFEIQLNAAEHQRYKDDLTRARMALEQLQESRSKEALDYRFQILETSVNRLKSLVGGDHFTGKAVDQNGRIINGEFLLYGPTGIFVSKERDYSGIPNNTTNMLIPQITPCTHYDAAELDALLKGGEGLLALDASGGEALSIESARWSLGEHVRNGGYVGYAIILFAGVSIAMSAFKITDFMSIRNRGRHDHSLVLELVGQGRISQAMGEASKSGYPLRQIMEAAICNYMEDDQVVEEIVVGVIQKVRIRLDRLLPFLAIIAAASPLMGLLGTVVGMIKTFGLITVFGSGEAKALSSGISEALVTTEFGLLVAIPTLLIHGAFVRASKARVGELEDFASDFVVCLKKLRGKGSGG